MGTLNLNPNKRFTSIEWMRTNVLEKARERGLKIEEKINNHFDEPLTKEKRKIIGKEVKTAARQFQRRRKQTESNARKEIMDAKKWKSDITKEEKRRRKEVTDWNRLSKVRGSWFLEATDFCHPHAR
jgi:hypothetical protein